MTSLNIYVTYTYFFLDSVRCSDVQSKNNEVVSEIHLSDEKNPTDQPLLNIDKPETNLSNEKFSSGIKLFQ